MLSAQLTGRIIIGWLFVFPPPPPGCQGPETCHGIITLIIFTIYGYNHCHPPPSPGCRAPETHQWVKGSRGPLSLFLRVNMQIIRANTQQGERLLRKLPPSGLPLPPLAGPTHPHPSNLGTAPFSRQRDLKALPYSSNVSHFNNRKRTIGHKMLIGHTFANLALTHDWVGLACGKEKSI